MIRWYKVLGFKTSNLSSMTQSAGSDEVATNPLLFFVFLIVQHACVQWCHWAFIEMLISVCVCVQRWGQMGAAPQWRHVFCIWRLVCVCVCVLMCISFIQGPINAAQCRALNGSLCESGYRAQLKRWKTEGLLKDGGQVPQDNELISKGGVNELCTLWYYTQMRLDSSWPYPKNVTLLHCLLCCTVGEHGIAAAVEFR